MSFKLSSNITREIRTSAGVFSRRCHPPLILPLHLQRQPSPSSSSSSSSAIRHYAVPPPPQNRSNAPTPPPRDDQIPYPIVQVVNLENKLSSPQSLSSVLRTYDPKTHTLIVVSSSPPIVKLIDRQEQNKRQRTQAQKSKEKKARRVVDVEIQISWESAEGDVKHKIARAKSVLEDGDRVKLVFAHKQGSEMSKLSGKSLQATITNLPATFLESLSDLSTEFKPPHTPPSSSPGHEVYVLHIQPNKDIKKQKEEQVTMMIDKKEEAKNEAKRKRAENEMKKLERAKEKARLAGEKPVEVELFK